MLGIYEFNQLTINEKANYLWENGTFLAAKDRINLYSLHNFFVEVYYHTELNKISDIKVFRSLSKLHDYLTDIDITSLTKLL